MHCARRGTRRWFTLAVAGVSLTLTASLTACSSGGTTGAGAGNKPAQTSTNQPVPVAQSVQVQQSPANGATGVNPAGPIKVSATNGSLNGIELHSSTGKLIKGTLDAENHTWAAAEELGYGKTYTWVGNAVGQDGKQVSVAGSFKTVDPERTSGATLNVGNGQTYGVGMPIKIDFDTAPKDRAAVEKALKVQTSPSQVEGSWAWLSPTSVHWRPKAYWPANTKVKVSANLYGVDMGSGTFGEQDLTSNFTIGREQIAKGDVTTHRFKVYNGNRQIADFPASYGLDSVLWRNTTSGTHVVMEKDPTYLMSNPKGGYSNVFVRWAVRFSNNGEFVHAYPETTWAQGVKNVSHGCVNLTTERAKEYFDYAQVGDPVVITGSRVTMDSTTGEYYDWSVPWDKWKSMSALAS